MSTSPCSKGPYAFVVLPVGLLEGLQFNHAETNPDKRFSLMRLALYALEELSHDLKYASSTVAPAELDLPRPKSWGRTGEFGYYSMNFPESFRSTWDWLCAQHDGRKDVTMLRAFKHQYKYVRMYYRTCEPAKLHNFPRID
jgi:hypothetical protein